MMGPLNHVLDLSDLPRDIFLLILDHVKPWDLIRCRRVSTSWYQAFTDLDTLQRVIKHAFPRAREVRSLLEEDSVDHNIWRPEAEKADWRALFDKVTSRYFHLTHGKPRYVEKWRLWDTTGKRKCWYPVSPFEHHESHPGAGRPRLFDHAFWSFDEGLLVFAAEECHGLVLLDIECSCRAPIPFSTEGRKVRNLRLKDRVLVIEWAELEPFHSLNESDMVHRHFVSCFDIIPASASTDLWACSKWRTVFRNEWKVHFLGLPLNERDRFFSTHDSQHYCVYFWQPNRSMYTGDELPIESLFVWDISCASTYLPSEDPSGKYKPADDATGPYVVAKFSFRDLEWYRIRQRSTPRLMKLELDSEMATIHVRENVILSGQGYFDPSAKLWCATTTSIPFIGHGPVLRREYEGSMLPPYRGNCSMETVDQRVRESWAEGIMDVVDSDAGVRYSLLNTVFGGKTALNWLLLDIEALGNHTTLSDQNTQIVSFKGKICGDERYLIGENCDEEIVILRFDKKTTGLRTLDGKSWIAE